MVKANKKRKWNSLKLLSSTSARTNRFSHKSSPVLKAKLEPCTNSPSHGICIGTFLWTNRYFSLKFCRQQLSMTLILILFSYLRNINFDLAQELPTHQSTERHKSTVLRPLQFKSNNRRWKFYCAWQIFDGEKSGMKLTQKQISWTTKHVIGKLLPTLFT